MSEIEFFIDGERVDLFDVFESPIKLNYIVLDLQFLSNRGGVVSNIFKVPATKLNNKVFGFYYDTQSQNQNFVISRNAKIFQGGVEIFSGLVKGQALYKTKIPASYEIQLKGNNLTWTEQMKNALLNTLEFKAFDPGIDIGVQIESSWTHTWTDEYACALTCWGRPYWYEEANNYNRVAIHPNPVGINKIPWDIMEFPQWYFIKFYLKKAFQLAGYKLVSNYFDTAEGEKLVFLPNNALYGKKTVLDFVRGVQNIINAFFYTDEGKKIVYMDPYDYFFSNIKKELNDKVDLSKTTKISQYGDNLTTVIFRMENDGIAEWVLENKKKATVPTTSQYYQDDYFVGGVKNSLVEKEYKNDFFGSYFMVGIPVLDGTKNADTISVPCLTTDGFQKPYDDTTNNLFYPLPDFQLNTFDEAGISGFKPVFGYYAGMTTIKKKDGTDNPTPLFFPAWWDYIFSTPPISQRPFVYNCDYRGEDGYKNFHYSNQVDDYNSPTVVMDGLVKKHYLDMLVSMRDGKLWKGYVKLNLSDLLLLDFTNVFTIEFLEGLLLEINNFRVGADDTTEVVLLERKKATTEDFLRLIQSGYHYIDGWQDT